MLRGPPGLRLSGWGYGFRPLAASARVARFGEGLGLRLMVRYPPAPPRCPVQAVHGADYFMHPVSASETGATSSIKYHRVHNVEFKREKLHILPSKRLLLPSKRLFVHRNRGVKKPGYGPGSSIVGGGLGRSQAVQESLEFYS